MSNDFTYGEAKEVAERMHYGPLPDHSDLVGAMINAMNRIARLENEVAELRKATNGMKPDQ